MMSQEIIQEKIEEIEHLKRLLEQERSRLSECQKSVSDLKEEIITLNAKLNKMKNMKDALSKKQIENSQKISGLEETIQLQKDTLES